MTEEEQAVSPQLDEAKRAAAVGLARTLTDVARLLVPPEAIVECEVEGTSDAFVLKLVVENRFRGALIGRSGRMARCLRSIVGAGAKSAGITVTLDIDDSRDVKGGSSE